jgi:hypothetical protein
VNIWDENKLLLFIAFVLPGFIAMKAYALLSRTKQSDTSKQIVDAIAYSCLNYALLFVPISLIERSELLESTPIVYFMFYSFVFFGFPIITVLSWWKIRGTNLLQKFLPHPVDKPWDFVFGKRQTSWVIVTLKNGEKVAGMFGLNSFASSAPAEEQIYLEEQWLLNESGGFERAVKQTSGIIILSSEILTVEFMHSGESSDE